MADKAIGDLPVAGALYDDSLLVVEQQSEARSIRGSLVATFAKEAAAADVQRAADAAASAAEQAKKAAEALSETGTCLARAETAATNAEGAAGRAAASEKNAETSAAQADAAKGAAQEEAAAAAASAVEAAEAAGKAVTEAEGKLSGYVDAAEAGATEAKKSAEAAGTAAGKAVADAEEQLSGYVSDAVTAKDAAEAAKADADASRKAAAASAEDAAKSLASAKTAQAGAETARDAAKGSADAAKESARDAADVALHPPILKDGNDHWWIWDTERNDYKDSGIDAGVSLEVLPDTVTGEPGSAAKVENLGTKTDPKLRFTLPQGETGDKGYSPSVEVRKEGKATNIVITDETGRHAATIYDGENGKDGDSLVSSVNAETGNVVTAFKFAVRLPASAWANGEQTVKSANFLADDKYVYLVDCDDAPIYGGKVTAEGEMVFHAGITPKEDVTVTIIRMTTVSLDDQFVARLDGTNTTESFWEWWPVAGETTPDKYERLCRWAGIMAEAWKDKTYTVHGYGYGVSGDPELTPMDDLAALGKAALATDQDGDMYDWAEEDPMTWYIRGNALSRQDGTMDILALEGESEFDLSGGTAPVYTFSMALWVKKEIDETTWIKSWKTVRADGYRPYAGDVGFVDNRKRAITWHPSFSGSLLDNGALTSGADRPAYLFRSSIAGIEAARKMTKYEGLWGDTDTNWLSDMWQLRHQNKGTTGVLSGCCDYDHQYQVAMAEENVRRVLLRPEQADDLIVGSTVSLGDNDSGSEYHDRNNTDMRDLADLVKIVSITDVHVNDTAYKAVALDIPADINVPDTAWISTMPWHSGSTEGVPGHKDGCLGGLTNKTYPVRIAGIEIFNGAYICGLDPLYTCVANETSGFDYAVYECRDSEKQACPSYTTIPDNYADTGITLHAVRSGWNSVKEYAPNDRDIVFPLSLGGSATTFYKSSFDGSYNSYIKAAHRFCTLTGGSLMNLLSQSTYRSPDIVDFQHSVSLGGSGKKRGIWKE